jgi:hypothetical protein
MSLIRSLFRFIDSISHRELEAADRRARERLEAQPDPDVTATVPPIPRREATLRRCRLCGRTEPARYCLACLADTMEDVS